MSIETTQLFWTMDDRDGLPPVTLCEACALMATKPVMILFGDTTDYQTMSELVAVADALVATAGGPGMGCTSSTTGRCGNCGVSA